MADLTQRVKYTVEVDSSALATLRLEVSTLIIGLENLNTNLKAVAASSKTMSASMASLAGRITASAQASSKAEIQLSSLITAQGEGNTSTHALANNVKALSDTLAMMASNARKAEAAMQAETKAINQNSGATDKAVKTQTESGLQFLKLFGKFQALKWIAREAFDAIKDGAQALDLDRVLGGQIKNYSAILSEAQKRTQGMVSNVELNKSMALMSSFGIPMERFGESMEFVQKMAIRTGQSADFLTDSFAKGISRLSPKILDNLGIQISLKDANEAYAQSVGKSTDALTQNERITAVLNATLTAMKKNTQGIDLGSSAGGAVARVEAGTANFINEGKKMLGQALLNADQMGESARQSISASIPEIKTFIAQLRILNKEALDPKAMAFYTSQIAMLQSRLEALTIFGGSEAVAQLLGNRGIFGTDRRQVGNAVFVSDADVQRALNQLNTLGNRARAEWDTLGAGVALDFVSKMVTSSDLAIGALNSKFAGLTEENKAKLTDMVKQATSGSAQAVLIQLRMAAEALNALYGNGGNADAYFFQLVLKSQALATNIEHIVELATRYGMNLQFAQDQSRILTEMDQRKVEFLDSQIAFQERSKLLAEGQTEIQLRLGMLKKEESAIDSDINQMREKMRTTEDESSKTQYADKIQALLVTKEEVRIRLGLASDSAKAQDEYFAKFKHMSKSQIDAELAKYELQKQQTAELERQFAIMLRIAATAIGSAVPVGAGAIAFAEDRLKAIENVIKRITATTSVGPGGSSSKETGAPYNKNRQKQMGDPEDTIQKWREARDAITSLQSELRQISATSFTDSTNPQMSVEGFKKYLELVDQLKTMKSKALADWGPGAMGDLFTDVNAANMTHINDEMAVMVEHFNKIVAMADGMNKFADGLKSAFAGMDGLVGGEYVAMMGDLTQGFEGLSKAIGENANAYGMVNAVTPIMRAFTHNLIKDRKAQAGIEMLMQAASAWASAAVGNVPAAVAHSTSAVMYGMIAGGVIKLPKGKSSEDKPASNGRNQAPRSDVHIYISGPIATTEAERGAMIRDALNAANRQGL